MKTYRTADPIKVDAAKRRLSHLGDIELFIVRDTSCGWMGNWGAYQESWAVVVTQKLFGVTHRYVFKSELYAEAICAAAAEWQAPVIGKQ